MDLRKTRANTYMIYQLVVIGIALFLLISDSVIGITTSLIAVYLIVKGCKAFEAKHHISYFTFSDAVWKDKTNRPISEIINELTTSEQ